MAPIAGSSNGVANSENRTARHDYTEGASAIDIQSAAAASRRARRESQYSNMYDEDQGSMFAGPGHAIKPSSVSRMAHSLTRRSSEGGRSRSRRGSRDSGVSGRPRVRRAPSETSQVSRQSSVVASDVDSEEGDDDERPGRSRRRRSPAPPSGMFSSIANLFGRHEPSSRRPSLSQRSSASISRSWRRRPSEAGSEAGEDEDERWGYSSAEDFSDSESSGSVNDLRDTVSLTGSMQYASDAEAPDDQGIPLLAADPVFGNESRVDMGPPFADLEPPPPGPPSRQIIYIADEDQTIRFVGCEIVWWRQLLWRICTVLSFGILALLGHWIPRIWLRWVTREKAFKELGEGLIIIESAFSDVTLYPVRIVDYPFHVTTVFPAVPAIDQSNEMTNGWHDNSSPSYDEDTQMLKQLMVVDYRYSRFALDPRTGLFSMVREWRDPSWSSVKAVEPGLEEPTRKQRNIVFGNNDIEIEGKSTIGLLVDEVIHPFYVFQIASVILWSLDDYYYYAFCIALISVASVTSTLIETKKTIARMREMSQFSCQLDVLVDGVWMERDSTELVPGDIINLSRSHITMFPADMFLLSGDAIVNESMLTGESVPVSKIPAKDDDLVQWREQKEESGKSFLYAGTRIIRIRGVMTADGTPGRPALAMVVRTGFNTTKGALVRSMLYPKPIGFKFYRDSVRFICVLAGIAGLGFAVSAVKFVEMGLKWHTIVVRALDLITVVVPPALPATLSIGTSFAIGRLRKLGIFCISPTRVNVGGKINVCCFDKTGTLTEDGLDILGVRGQERGINRFGELIEDPVDIPIPLGKEKCSFLHALATCHSLKVIDGEVIGDPLDAKMFEFTGWTLDEGRAAGVGAIKDKSGQIVEQASLVQVVVRPPGSESFKLEDALKGGAKRAHFLELGVIRTFEFVSQLRRMSVVVKRLRSSSMEIYVKGAPEVMGDICEKDSFPTDYDDLLSYYTKRGYRVIAIAGKSIEGLTWLKAQRMKREQAESGLRFLGLVIFENKLKPGTTPAIQALRSAHFACRMITGDNPLTAVSVARECSLINQTSQVFAPQFVRGGPNVPSSRLEWSSMDDMSWKLDSYSLKPLPPLPHHAVDPDAGAQDFALVVTGDVFRWMITYAPLETLQRMLVKAQIFARMSPDEKNEVVERLQGLGYSVLMCGDGANDCAALKAADVGISLSEAEASVAAPFTASTPDIGCVIEVIKEGRAALVTSFSCFKYMALYSLIQFTSVTLLYSFASSLGDFQFLYIDLFIIIPVAIAMARTLPYPRLHPTRPTASLVSKKVLSSIIGQIIITGAVQVWAFLWVRDQDWYTAPRSGPKEHGNNLQSRNYENSVLFLSSAFQYILIAAVFSIGPPYRKSMYTNAWLMAALLLLTAFNVVVLLVPPQPVADLLDLMPLPMSGRWTLLVAAVINVIACVVYESWGAQLVAQAVGRVMSAVRGSRGRTRVREGKTYKAVEGSL
ncbi:hypothetical protein EV122DRAFT_271611 [Schizophyllum commune]